MSGISLNQAMTRLSANTKPVSSQIAAGRVAVPPRLVWKCRVINIFTTPPRTVKMQAAAQKWNRFSRTGGSE